MRQVRGVRGKVYARGKVYGRQTSGSYNFPFYCANSLFAKTKVLLLVRRIFIWTVVSSPPRWLVNQKKRQNKRKCCLRFLCLAGALIKKLRVPIVSGRGGGCCWCLTM